jgi:hypothetical protein
MFINMNDVFETYEVDIETYIENRLVNKQRMQAPKEIIELNFVQLMNQVANDKRPLKVRMTRPETIWDNFENKQKVITNEIAFSNNAMIAYEESKAGDTND